VLRQFGVLAVLVAVLALAPVIESAWGYTAAAIIAVVALGLLASGYWPADRRPDE
jgi:uncharacterized membrane protein YadS